MFYDYLEKLCISRSMSVFAVTSKLGIPASTVSYWKKSGATPKGTTLAKLASFFNVSIDYFVYGNNDETVPSVLDNNLRRSDFMFYDKFLSLCEDVSKKPSIVADEIGINRATVTAWKKNGYAPRQQILEQLATYFDVSIDYLLGKTDEKNPTRAAVTDADIKFALFGGMKVSDKVFEDVKRLAILMAEKEMKENGET